ncbi:thiamine pyrophosphate-dependent enzyme [Streptomyces sp. BRA346]|uniref:thiamine pyrophosphate-dependent enzyme n=1 Tax=Streptomyces sp. BRA346 TaxID=2878199 RepID=UPI004062E938
MRAALSARLATPGASVPHAVAARLAFPELPVIAPVGDAALQSSGMNELGRGGSAQAECRAIQADVGLKRLNPGGRRSRPPVGTWCDRTAERVTSRRCPPCHRSRRRNGAGRRWPW